MKIYFVSGLAADSRVFKNLRVPGHCEAVFLEWIPPLKNESLPDYALRMASAIDTREPFGLVGLSMGGMIVSEIAGRFKPAVLILISSINSSAQLPFYFKAAGKLRLHRAVPVELVKKAALVKRRITKETPEEKDILRQIIRDSDADFIRWAMDAILKWKSTGLPAPDVHIHGNRDEVLPIRFTSPTHIIKKGGHLMVMTRAREINRILEERLVNVKI
ncbi:MAG: alpha/beta hydrolase [Bacteroidota bacterium]|nr:alpha/beta hydrolase [Bacteroidota bacterium]